MISWQDYTYISVVLRLNNLSSFLSIIVISYKYLHVSFYSNISNIFSVVVVVVVFLAITFLHINQLSFLLSIIFLDFVTIKVSSLLIIVRSSDQIQIL
jgi:hypothetical protein